MALRKIVQIDEEKCDGCGVCVPSCAEGAIRVIDGKARLLGENLCDGLGACLGACPQDAITIEEREAEEFDEAAVEAHLVRQEADVADVTVAGGAPEVGIQFAGCPGSRAVQFPEGSEAPASNASPESPPQLRQWPVQLHLVPPNAPYLQDADVLLAADCTAYALGNFHDKYLKGRSLAIACPKLDSGMDTYLAKLVSMIDDARINTLSVMMMEVPCCSGLIRLAKEATNRASRKVPIRQLVVGIRGDILADEWV